MKLRRYYILILTGIVVGVLGYYSFVTLKRKYVMYEYFHNGRWEKLQSKYNKIKKTRKSIILFGDSMTELFKKYLHESDSIKNMGISGDFTEGLLKRIDNVTKYQPEKIFIMIGINDIVEKVPLSEIETNYLKIYDILKKYCPKTKIYFESTLPTRNLNSLLHSSKDINKTVIELNTFLQNTAKEKNCIFINMYSAFVDNHNYLRKELTTDGVHLNKAGYLIWQSYIKNDIRL